MLNSTSLSEEVIKNLVKKATEAMQNAYAPYSDFHVGAALLTSDDEIVLGCNVENISLSPTICAERTAIVTAIVGGSREFKAIAVVSSDSKLTPPCGVCRQVMSEFVDGDFPVILASLKGEYELYPFREILPMSFKPNSSIGNRKIEE